MIEWCPTTEPVESSGKEIENKTINQCFLIFYAPYELRLTNLVGRSFSAAVLRGGSIISCEEIVLPQQGRAKWLTILYVVD